jgi:hypothetical protein
MRSLTALPALSDVANTALPLRLGTVHVTPEGLLGIRETPPPSSQRFVLDDLPFQVALSPEGDGTRYRIWAELGYVPYTAHSPERRAAVVRILRAARSLETACFALERGQKIVVLGETVSEEPLTVDGMMFETVRFLQEARPFIRLLGRYL